VDVATIVELFLKHGLLGAIVLVEGYVIAKLYAKVERQNAELLELAKAQGATNEKVAAALNESSEALKESAVLNAQLRDYLERRRRA
jgi:alcohol dehydrogenase class IV